MAKFEEGQIYEFIENLYDELSLRDGGYYPSIHDPEVFKKAANQFNKSEEEIKKIYCSFQDIVAKKEIEKLNKLPIKQRKEKTMELLGNIVKNNKDLPYYRLEGAATEPIKSGLETINEEYRSIAEDIGKNGWTIPMGMGLSEFDKLRDTNKNIEAYDSFFTCYYNSKNIKLMIKHINASPITQKQKELFNECIEAFQKSKYSLCATVLITILEGILSDFGDNKNDIRMIRICRINMDKTREQKKIIIHLVWISFFNFISSLYKKSDFDKDEPIKINRHWILHGRTEMDWKAEDCLRLFNAIYSLVTMKKYDM